VRSGDRRREWRREILARLADLDTRDAPDIVEELVQHVHDRYEALLDSGMSLDDARRVALDELAAPHVLGRALRPVVRRPAPAAPALGRPSQGSWWSGLRHDVRDGVRALRATPGPAFVATLTLALGIGANVAIFSIVNVAMLRPLPFADPDRLVTFWGSAPRMGLPVVNYPDALFAFIRERTRTLGSTGAWAGSDLTLTAGSGHAERLQGASVTSDFFRTLGRTPAMGRDFLPEEQTRGGPPVAILSDALWRRRFGSASDLVGRTITLEGQSTTVVGIMPPGFDFPRRAEFWIPLPLDPQSVNCWCYDTIGRLGPGQTPDDAQRELARLHDDFFHQREGRPKPDAASEPNSLVVATPLERFLLGDVRTPLLVLWGAVAMVLLIACANVANLLLARATARTREIAVRCCLGASPWLIVRQLLVESLLLAATGAALGLALGAAGAAALGRFAAERLPHVNGAGLDAAVVAFTISVMLVTVILCGVAPAIRSARLELQDAIKDGGRTTRGAPGRRLSQAFVVVQCALSLVLLAGAGLLLRSLGNLLSVDPGFRAEHVLVGRVAIAWQPQRSTSENLQEARLFFGQLLERVAALPGVRHAGLTSNAPFSAGGNRQPFTIRGREPGVGEPTLVASIRAVTADYFAAIGTPVLHGRAIEAADSEQAPLVAVVDETLARRFWPDGNAVGHHVRIGGGDRAIVGVVAAVKDSRLAAESDRYVYVPYAQSPRIRMDLVVRAGTAPEAQVAAIREQIRALDPSVPFFSVQALEDAVDRSLATERVTNALLLAFAATALVLAAVGIYGVTAVGVSQRANELAIRQALGATPGTVVRLVTVQGLSLALPGVAIGLTGAVVLGRYIETLLFGVTPMDVPVLAGTTGLLVGVAAFACLIPARRATAVDPLDVLRR
jgi:predicted permease